MAARSLGGIEIKGVNELRRRLDPRVFNRTQKIAQRRAALRVRREARNIVPGKRFDDAILYHVDADGLRAIVFTDAAAGESIHDGRKPGHPPNLKALQRWIRTYGMAGAVSVKTRRVVRRKQQASASAIRATEALAIQLQRGIREAGTKPIRFLTDALGPSSADIERYWREALEDTVKHFARKGAALTSLGGEFR